MHTVYPDYYPQFQCIAGACRHSCCIGWEIDIDEASAEKYAAVTGSMGARLARAISHEGTPHFLLGEGERCPFLNGENLCDLILELGDSHLCEICAEHPRFYNEYEDRTEVGVGLCCEAAGALILGRAEPVRLLGGERLPNADSVLALRDRAIGLLQDRTRAFDARLSDMLSLCGVPPIDFDPHAWCERLLELERMDNGWTQLLERLQAGVAHADLDGFRRHMEARMTEYEQFTVYLVYRHLACAADFDDFAARAAFAALGYRILFSLGAVLWMQSGQFSFEDQVELARLFSAEIEYSEENTEALLEEVGDWGNF